MPANASTLGLVNGLPFQRGSTTIMGGTPATVTAALASLNAAPPAVAAQPSTFQQGVQPRTMEPMQPIAPGASELERHSVAPTTDPMAKPLTTPIPVPTNGAATHTPIPAPLTPLQTEEMPSPAALLAMQVAPPNAAPRTSPMKAFTAEPARVEPMVDDLESTTHEAMRHVPPPEEKDFAKTVHEVSADLVAKPPVMAPAPPPRLGTATGTDHIVTPAAPNGTAMMMPTAMPLPDSDPLPPPTPLGLGPAPTAVLTDSSPNFEAAKADAPNAATALLDESSSPDLQLPTKEELERLPVKTAPADAPVQPGPVTPTVQPELILASEIQVRPSDTPPKNEKLGESSPWLREASAIPAGTIVESSYKPPPISEAQPKDELAEKAKARAAAGGSKTTTIIIGSAVVVAALGIGVFLMRDKLFGGSTSSAKTEKSSAAQTSTTTAVAVQTPTTPANTVTAPAPTTPPPPASTPVAVASQPSASAPAAASSPAASASASASASAKVRPTSGRPPQPPVTIPPPTTRPPGYDPGGI